jgi:copper transport protein
LAGIVASVIVGAAIAATCAIALDGRAANDTWGSRAAVPWPAVHVALRASDPAAGDTLAAPPRLLRLAFTERIELPLTRLTLVGSDSAAVELSPVRGDSTGTAIEAEVIAPLRPGTYRVRWTVAARDAHAVHGDFTFTVGASASAPESDSESDSALVTPVPPAQTPDGPPSEPEFDARSPAYAAVRWLTYAGLLGVIGALVFRFAVLGRVHRLAGDDPDTVAFVARAERVGRIGGIGAALLLIIAAALRLAAQVRSVVGEMVFERELVSGLLTGTAWGWGWIAQVTAALAVLATLVAATRDGKPRTLLEPTAVAGGLAALVLAVSAAVSGHPAAADPAIAAVAFDAVHVLAVGGWIGTLVFVAFVGIPAASAVGSAARSRVVRDQVVVFSRVALPCAAAIALTGGASSWMQMRSIPALWTTGYGQTLLLKLAFVALVGAIGAYNWRIVTPRLLEPGGVGRIRAAMAVEIVFAMGVLAVTAALAATPPPVDAMTGESEQSATAGRPSGRRPPDLARHGALD